MQLNKTKFNTIPLLNPNPYPLAPLNISFLCAFAPLRDKIRANSCSPVVSVVEPLVVQTDNIRQFPGKSNAKNLISPNEPNFKKLMSTLTHEITRNYDRSHRNNHPKNEPKANPIRTQYEPNTNPIRTQYGPNQTQFKANFKMENPSLFE